MTTLAKFITALILSTLLVSCKFNSDSGFGVSGNRSVEITKRNISNDFSGIKASRGLDVYITQGNTMSLSVEADENLQDIIITKVKNNVLQIYADENIKSAKAKKVMLTINDIKNISASSGSHIFTTNTINGNRLELFTSSGASIKIEVDAKVIECSSSSGSSIHVSGSADELYANSFSGSHIKARDLKTNNTTAKASSGSGITVNTSEELYANASSGAHVKYYGNPQKVTKKNGVSGSVKKQ